MQSAGAELMRAVTIELVREGVELIASVHDAFVIESEEDKIEADSEKTRAVIAKVSRAIFGQPLKSQSHITRYPGRYIDEDAGEMLANFDAMLRKYGYAQLLNPLGTHPRPRTNTP
jgi:hypothetical protein